VHNFLVDTTVHMGKVAKFKFSCAARVIVKLIPLILEVEDLEDGMHQLHSAWIPNFIHMQGISSARYWQELAESHVTQSSLRRCATAGGNQGVTGRPGDIILPVKTI
jgi:hypothetical protein